ncbi:hypothetical protein PIB30_056405 [Stylosanthes scabra]|uniref:CCHC-type domain-containing protein n=1 Tax=Stylosanthes scabra TaxID=79078 RepID=A0ABU6XJN7_9FABA|nr:hypothetical protein [Stylosanthes scabra]
MLEDCRELVKLSCRFFEDYHDVKTKLANERQALPEKHRQRQEVGDADDGERVSLRDPAWARHKGCGRRGMTTSGKFRRVQRCRRCGRSGHNARRCSQASERTRVDGGDLYDSNFWGILREQKRTR